MIQPAEDNYKLIAKIALPAITDENFTRRVRELVQQLSEDKKFTVEGLSQDEAPDLVIELHHFFQAHNEILNGQTSSAETPEQILPVDSAELDRRMTNMQELLEMAKEIYTTEGPTLPKMPTTFGATLNNDLIGSSREMEFVREEITRVAKWDFPVIIAGETGTGKELIAESIHNLSERVEGPFVPINCALLDGDTIVSEIFGHEKGAFTGATEQRIGLIEQANGGTLFLDELHTLSLRAQEKLLRVLERNEFTRMGGVETVKVDIRIVVATNAELDEAVSKGEIREDFYYRLNTDTVYSPPLSVRLEDLEQLVTHNLKREEQRILTNTGYAEIKVDPGVYTLLRQYHFPGNVRELNNLTNSALTRMPRGSNILRPGHFPLPEISTQTGDILETLTAPEELSYRDKVKWIESQIIHAALDQHNWIRSDTAWALKINRTTLFKKMKEYELTEGTSKNKYGFPEITEESYHAHMAYYDKKFILEALQKHDNDQHKTAEALGINRTTLYKKRAKYDLLKTTISV